MIEILTKDCLGIISSFIKVNEKLSFKCACNYLFNNIECDKELFTIAIKEYILLHRYNSLIILSTNMSQKMITILSKIIEELGIYCGIDFIESNKLLNSINLSYNNFMYNDPIKGNRLRSVTNKTRIKVFEHELECKMRLVCHSKSRSIGLDKNRISILLTKEKVIGNKKDVLIMRLYETL